MPLAPFGTMNLQEYLVRKFESWQPTAPETMGRSKSDVTLSWSQGLWQFLDGDVMYRIERKEKLPPWVVVYSGSKTTQRIDNLAPCSPHKFRLRVILKASAVPLLADRAIQYYGTDSKVYQAMNGIDEVEDVSDNNRSFIKEAAGMINNDNEDVGDGGKIEFNGNGGGDTIVSGFGSEVGVVVDGSGDKGATEDWTTQTKHKWLESRWSEETCTSTDTDGTSAACFCMAVRGGYLKQMQIMLEERPALIGIINSTNGFTPLATAVRKGDINTVRYLLAAGSEVDQRSSTGQTPLHLAVLSGHAAIADLLLEKGADFHARDRNEMCVEHYAVDSGDVDVVRFILDRGGEVDIKDSNGWTPLFRAVCQGASSAMVEELVLRGSDIDLIDNAGLTVSSAARLLHNRHGQKRDSVLRLVDSQYPHEKALANFTKLTKKISSVHTLLKN